MVIGGRIYIENVEEDIEGFIIMEVLAQMRHIMFINLLERRRYCFVEIYQEGKKKKIEIFGFKLEQLSGINALQSAFILHCQCQRTSIDVELTMLVHVLQSMYTFQTR